MTKKPTKPIKTGRHSTFKLADTITKEPITTDTPKPIEGELLPETTNTPPELLPLKGKQQRFVDAYLIDPNATQAAITAGYSAKTATVIGAQNLTKLNIKAAIDKAQAKISEASQVDAEYVISTTKTALEVCQQRIPLVDKAGEPVMVAGHDGTLVTGYTLVNAMAAFKGLDQLSRHLGLYDKDNAQRAGDGGPRVINEIQISFIKGSD